MKRLNYIFILLVASVLPSYADTCDQSNSASGNDDDPVIVTISSFSCTGGGTITAITLDASIGEYCPDPDNWYSYNIIVNGSTILTDQCDQTGLDLSTYMPITSVAVQSSDDDEYSDPITLSLTLHITFTPAACPGPSAQSVNNITTSGADLVWTDPGGTYWDLYIVPAGSPAPNTGTTPSYNDLVNNSYPWSGGSPNTDYDWYVRRDCGQNNSNVSIWTGPNTFSTLCNPITTFPWNESFEGTWIPDCWTDLTTAAFGWNQSTYGSAHSGTDWAYCNLVNAELIAPTMTLNADYRMKFWYRVEGSTYPQDLAVKIGNTVILQLTGITNATYQEAIVPLTAYNGQTIAIKFVSQTGEGGYDFGICLDDVSVEEMPSCPEPVSQSSGNSTTNGADLGWTDAAGTHWDLYIVPAGSAAPNTSSTPGANDITTNPYTWTGSPANATYDWYVRRDCGQNNSFVSAWTGPGQFTTLTSPVIIYTPLGNTSSTAERTLAATISGEGGVPVSGTGLPVCYWKIGADGSWNNSQGTHTTGSQYDFDFGTGAISGDTVFYYLVAKDNSPFPNILASPVLGASGYTASPPACSTIPSEPNSYRIASALSGTVTVGGAGGDYSNLTGDGGLFNSINDNVLNDNVTAYIMGDLTEDGTHSLNQWSEEGGGGYSLTIRPGATLTPTISGTYDNGALLRFTGASRVSLIGSNGGGPNRDLTITNTSTTSPSVILIGSIGTSTITDISITYCNIINGSTNSSALVVSDTLSSNEGYFDNLEIRNNSFQKAYIGVFIKAAEGEGTNISVSENLLNTSGTNNISYMGLYFQGVDNCTVSGNIIGNFENASGQNDKGIWIASGCTSVDVYNNNVDNLGYSGTSGYGAQGIYVSTANLDAGINVFNNLISNLTGDGDDYTNSSYYSILYNPIGIFLITEQSGISVYNNSISLSGNTLNYDVNAMSIGICVAEGTTADIRNNIIVNNLGLAGATGYGACGIYAETTAGQFTDINHNDYYVTATGSGVNAIGKISNTTTALSLGDWQIATGKDLKSIAVDPLYLGAADLGLTTGSPAIGKGTPLASVPDDYSGNARHPFKPTIGAYDYQPPNFFMWNGLINTDWNTAENWTPNGVPGINDDAGIPDSPPGFPNFPTVPLAGGPFNVDELYVGQGASIEIPMGATLNVKNNNP
jgi:hypothetical protein